MSRRRPASLSLLLVGLLVVSAGCSGLFGADEDAVSSSDPDTVTPAPLPDEAVTSTATEGEYPPGIGPNGVTNRSALVAAHVAALTETSYTFVSTTNGSVSGYPTVVFAVENGSTGAIWFRANESRVGIEYWSPELSAVRQCCIHGGLPVPNTTRVQTVTETQETVAPSERVSIHRQLLRFSQLEIPPAALGTDPTITRIERDGAVFYRLSNGETAMYVREDGFVRTVVTVRVGIKNRYTYRDVGNTTVTRPTWVRDALRTRTTGGTDTDVLTETASSPS
ncbi:hypothetical protein [Halosimplex marinum]|uniref:hypothetical protein n=1 Tax=Halosimplex marinum TaxID=3396620 RepID=UPI003F54C8D1